MDELTEKIKEMIEQKLEAVHPNDLDWGDVEDDATDIVSDYLVEQITDAYDYDWLVDLSRLVAQNEGARIVQSLKGTKWYRDVVDNAICLWDESIALHNNPYKYYGAPRWG